MTRHSRQQASLVVLCLDGTQPLAPWELEELFTTARRTFPRNLCVTEGFRAPVGRPSPLAVPPSVNVADRPAVVVVTKIDDPQTADLTALLSSLPDWVEAEDRTEVVRLRLTTAAEEQSVELLKVSSHREVGLDRLREVLQHRLLEQGEVEAGVVASTATRCHESLRLSCEALVRARDLAVAQAGDELVAIEIRTALEELGKVVGTVYTEDILERIFSRFCIGK